MSEIKTLRLHTNQEEEYPAIMREYGVLKNPFTTIRVHVCTMYTEPFPTLLFTYNIVATVLR